MTLIAEVLVPARIAEAAVIHESTYLLAEMKPVIDRIVQLRQESGSPQGNYRLTVAFELPEEERP